MEIWWLVTPPLLSVVLQPSSSRCCCASTSCTGTADRRRQWCRWAVQVILWRVKAVRLLFDQRWLDNSRGRSLNSCLWHVVCLLSVQQAASERWLGLSGPSRSRGATSSNKLFVVLLLCSLNTVHQTKGDARPEHLKHQARVCFQGENVPTVEACGSVCSLALHPKCCSASCASFYILPVIQMACRSEEVASLNLNLVSFNNS